ncbi:hypothetical protein F511_04726 [Dorcoceras hygrometricum]|uniref:Uncharacterized protein n=1 Tax=Dorcoceras hygrometricum TaxID=472368 RepID=A0A2Z7B0L7_9LAMI|nr:hypothetical protein F511_04726 [Dorcoceras hygrometricum]
MGRDTTKWATASRPTFVADTHHRDPHQSKDSRPTPVYRFETHTIHTPARPTSVDRFTTNTIETHNSRQTYDP